MKRKAFIAAAVALMAGGLWWQFKPATDSATPEPEAPETVTTPNQPTPTGPQDSTDPTDAPGTVDEDSISSNADLARCTPTDGYGIVLEPWGNVRLPYGDKWPRNEPGTPVDCSPDTDFGAAVTAVHSLYIESLSPELIPELAVDTPGRQLRINQHGGKGNAENVPVVCKPIGWDKPQTGISVWYIYHQCEGGPIKLTPVRMRRVDDKWLMVYEPDGRVILRDAPSKTEYYPFEGGD